MEMVKIPFIIERKTEKRWNKTGFGEFKTKKAALKEIRISKKILLENSLVNKTIAKKYLRLSNFRIVEK